MSTSSHSHPLSANCVRISAQVQLRSPLFSSPLLSSLHFSSLLRDARRLIHVSSATLVHIWLGSAQCIVDGDMRIVSSCRLSSLSLLENLKPSDADGLDVLF